jgi:ABC-type multidrug transport system fused ATPase/permease subunit
LNFIEVLILAIAVEEGSHDELVNQGGWYAEAWALQSQKQNKETNNLI